MKTINTLSRIVVCTLLVVMFNACYAATVKIPCAPSPEAAEWKTVRNNDPHARYVLNMVGIKVDGKEELVTDWIEYMASEDHPPFGTSSIIVARCPTSGKRAGFLVTGEADPPLVCERGEAIQIKMREPSDPNPKKYIAVLDLQKEIVAAE